MVMPPAPSQPPEPAWSVNWKEIQPMLNKVRGSMASLRSSPLRIMRVSQLDADILDSELLDILKEQLWNSLSLFKSSVKDSWEPELLAMLNLILFKLSVYDMSATYGEQLQNLKYRNEWRHRGALESIAKDSPLTKTQKIAYGLFTVGGQYAWTRLNRWAISKRWSEIEDESDFRRKLHRFIHTAERYWKVFSLLNFLIFLYNGRYRTLIDRFLCMRLVNSRKSLNRQVSFEFLNRQLVWHAFTEFLLFLVPLINVEKLKQRVKRAILPTSLLVSNGYDKLPINQCAICYESMSSDGGGQNTTVHHPHKTSCGHVYCYYCIRQKMAIYGNEWLCMRCGSQVESIDKVADIIEDGEKDTKQADPDNDVHNDLEKPKEDGNSKSGKE